jgi:nitrogen regulatory protein PII
MKRVEIIINESYFDQLLLVLSEANFTEMVVSEVMAKTPTNSPFLLMNRTGSVQVDFLQKMSLVLFTEESNIAGLVKIVDTLCREKESIHKTPANGLIVVSPVDAIYHLGA